MGLGLRLEGRWQSASMCSCGAQMSDMLGSTYWVGIVYDDVIDGPDLGE